MSKNTPAIEVEFRGVIASVGPFKLTDIIYCWLRNYQLPQGTILTDLNGALYPQSKALIDRVKSIGGVTIANVSHYLLRTA